jgi:translation initiation factor IF-2
MTGSVTSLQRDQESVKEVREGYECGMKTKTPKKIEIGDIIEYYIME